MLRHVYMYALFLFERALYYVDIGRSVMVVSRQEVVGYIGMNIILVRTYGTPLLDLRHASKTINFDDGESRTPVSLLLMYGG